MSPDHLSFNTAYYSLLVALVKLFSLEPFESSSPSQTLQHLPGTVTGFSQE